MPIFASAATSTAIPWAALIPLVVIELCFDVYCIVDLVRHPAVRRLPRWAWVVATIAVNPFGGIAYLLFGRSEDR